MKENHDRKSKLQSLEKSIVLAQENFALILIRCNYPSLRQRLLEQLSSSSSLDFREITLLPSTNNLYEVIEREHNKEPLETAIISGLEVVTNFDKLAIAANNARDELRKNFPFPFVLWLTDELESKLRRLAPDLSSWSGTPIPFNLGTDELINLLQKTTEKVFSQALAAQTIDSLPTLELQSAWKDLNKRNIEIEPELEAALEFCLALGSKEKDIARQHYQQSLDLYNSTEENNQEKGCLLIHFGHWYHREGEINPRQSQEAYSQAKDYFEKAIDCFEKANRPDLVAKCINYWGEMLQRLEQWEELEFVINKALPLHRTYPNPIVFARTKTLAAELAISRSQWPQAKKLAQEALNLFPSYLPSTSPLSMSLLAVSEVEACLCVTKAQINLGEKAAARTTLETAKEQNNPQQNLYLHLRILEELHQLYSQEQGLCQSIQN